MVDICPSITAYTKVQYQRQLNRVTLFAHHLHIDLMDDEFTSRPSVKASELWWPVGVKADIHIMYQQPLEILDQIVALGPRLVIVHAEASGSFIDVARTLHASNIKVGVAVLQQTPIAAIKPALALLDHVLIFSGDLGNFGGKVDFSLLKKIQYVKNFQPNLEIGWDGGITDANAARLLEGGVNILNVGGFIQKAKDPLQAYAKLKMITHKANSHQ